MRGIGIVFRREMAAYFTSPIAYLIAAAFLLVTGLVFNTNLTLSVTQRPVNPVPNALAFFLIFFGPVLTMRLLAEEAREGTLELLLTAPINERAIVFGKFLSAWAYFTLLLLLTLVYQVILVAVARPEVGQAVSAYIGIWLYGGAVLAIGLFFSAMTDSQVLAAFLSVAALTLLYLGEQAGQIVANLDLANLIRTLTLPGHYTGSFAVGLIRFEDFVFFSGVIVVMLYVALRALEARRTGGAGWQGRGVRSLIGSALGVAFLLTVVSGVYAASANAALTLDMTESRQYSLSRETLTVLQRVKEFGQPIRITGFYSPNALTFRQLDDAIARLYEEETDGLISREYFDPNENRTYSERFNLQIDGELFVSYLDANGEVDFSTVRRVTAENSQERNLTNAILRLLDINRFEVAFEVGSSDIVPDDSSAAGYSGIIDGLEANGIETFGINLNQLAIDGQDVPNTVTTLMLLQMREPLSAGAVQVLDRYFARGGRAFVFADADYGASPFLSESDPFNAYLWERFGVRMRDAVVIDALSNAGTELDVLSYAVSDGSTITARLNDPENPFSRALFRVARAVQIDPEPPVQNGMVVATSPESYGETDLTLLGQSSRYAFEVSEDIAGPLNLAAWANDTRTGARLVLVGDQNFLSNGLVQNPEGNGILFTDAITWLTGFGESVIFAPQARASNLPTVFISTQDLDNIALITTLLLPGAVLLLGVGIRWWRGRR
ncbi:MAG: Gldg family protein [Anaerolineae bacterium]|nr:Gldg family protein [Anaerolineae bacterium]